MQRINDEIKHKIINDYTIIGKSKSQIARENLLSKGTVFYILKGFICKVNHNSKEERIKRYKNCLHKIMEFDNGKLRMKKEIREKISQYMKINNKKIPNAEIGNHLSHIRFYTDEELKQKGKLEVIYGILNHEKNNDYYFDFTNENFIIETTNDYGKGISKAIERLSSVDDSRSKILFCRRKNFGNKRIKLAVSFNIKIYDIECFMTNEKLELIQEKK